MSKAVKKSSTIRRLEQHGCTDLAAKLAKRQGPSFQLELRGSLNGQHPQNAYRQTVAALMSRDLQDKGLRHAKRTVDHTCRVFRVNIKPAERDILAYMLHKGLLRK